MKRLLVSAIATFLSSVGPAFAAEKDVKAAANTPSAAQKAPSASAILDLNTASE